MVVGLLGDLGYSKILKRNKDIIGRGRSWFERQQRQKAAMRLQILGVPHTSLLKTAACYWLGK